MPRNILQRWPFLRMVILRDPELKEVKWPLELGKAWRCFNAVLGFLEGNMMLGHSRKKNPRAWRIERIDSSEFDTNFLPLDPCVLSSLQNLIFWKDVGFFLSYVLLLWSEKHISIWLSTTQPPTLGVLNCNGNGPKKNDPPKKISPFFFLEPQQLKNSRSFLWLTLQTCAPWPIWTVLISIPLWSWGSSEIVLWGRWTNVLPSEMRV